MRPAAMFARTAMRFHSKIRVAKNGNEADGKIVMGLISLGVAQGESLRIRIERTDADEAIRELEQLIQSGFDEDSL